MYAWQNGACLYMCVTKHQAFGLSEIMAPTLSDPNGGLVLGAPAQCTGWHLARAAHSLLVHIRTEIAWYLFNGRGFLGSGIFHIKD